MMDLQLIWGRFHFVVCGLRPPLPAICPHFLLFSIKFRHNSTFLVSKCPNKRRWRTRCANKRGNRTTARAPFKNPQVTPRGALVHCPGGRRGQGVRPWLLRGRLPPGRRSAPAHPRKPRPRAAISPARDIIGRGMVGGFLGGGKRVCREYGILVQYTWVTIHTLSHVLASLFFLGPVLLIGHRC